jgi:hypothetical protein
LLLFWFFLDRHNAIQYNEAKYPLLCLTNLNIVHEVLFN